MVSCRKGDGRPRPWRLWSKSAEGCRTGRLGKKGHPKQRLARVISWHDPADPHPDLCRIGARRQGRCKMIPASGGEVIARLRATLPERRCPAADVAALVQWGPAAMPVPIFFGPRRHPVDLTVLPFRFSCLRTGVFFAARHHAQQESGPEALAPDPLLSLCRWYGVGWLEA